MSETACLVGAGASSEILLMPAWGPTDTDEALDWSGKEAEGAATALMAPGVVIDIGARKDPATGTAGTAVEAERTGITCRVTTDGAIDCIGLAIAIVLQYQNF
mmetsp:Transcript_65425/g.102997  ORF Transcript_65425/g.102997 Transcript_65425/m.102997 type:complete len:103 (-) Transcript_65425:11-319(-)